MAMIIIRLLVPEEIPRPVVEWNDYILRERTHGTVLWPGVVRERVGIKAATDVVVDMQERLSSVRISLPWTRVQKIALQRSTWTSCKSSGHGLLTKGEMGMSWSLTGQLNTTVPPPGLQVVDRRHQGTCRAAWRT